MLPESDVNNMEYVLSFIYMIADECFMKYLGKRIKDARLLAGFTQEKLAEKVGVSRAAISRWELGEIEPKLGNFVKLASVLCVSTDYLLGTENRGKKCELGLSDEGYSILKKFVKEIKKSK